MKLLATITLLGLLLASCDKQAREIDRAQDPQANQQSNIVRVVPLQTESSIIFNYSVSSDGGKTWSKPKLLTTLDRDVKILPLKCETTTPRHLDRFSHQYRNGEVFLAFSTYQKCRHITRNLQTQTCVWCEYYFARSGTAQQEPVRVRRDRPRIYGSLHSPGPKFYYLNMQIALQEDTIEYQILSAVSRGEKIIMTSNDGGKTWK